MHAGNKGAATLCGMTAAAQVLLGTIGQLFLGTVTSILT
jgi:hypothetical protein